MFIYIFKSNDESHIDITQDEHVKELNEYKKGKSWIMLGCEVYIIHINEKYNDIELYKNYYEEKYLKNIQPSVVPIGIENISVEKYLYNMDLVEPYGKYNLKNDIWIKSCEIKLERKIGSMAYKVDSFVTADRTQLYNVIYETGACTNAMNLNEYDLQSKSFTKHIDYSHIWTYLSYDPLESCLLFWPHPDSPHKKD